MEKFTFEPTSLSDLISTSYFTVPKYQRSFAWDSDETKDYWNDMESAIESGDEYFLGNIVLTRNSADNTCSIIDGQQRIATTTILNAAIRDIFKAENEADDAHTIQHEHVYALDTSKGKKNQRIRLNEIDNPFYQRLLIDKVEVSPDRESHVLIKKAYDYFLEQLQNLKAKNPDSWKEEFAKIAFFLKSQSKVVAVYAATDADAFIIFETLNDRGANLTIADLLKNYLFSKSDNQIDSVQKNWIEARAILEEYQDESEFKTFLRHFWSSVHGMTRERELYKKMKASITDSGQAVKFSEDMRNGARYYGAALNEKAEFWKDYSETDKGNLKRLLKLKLEQNRPLLIAVFQHFPKTEIQKAIPALVSWSVRGLIHGVMGKGAAEKAFCDSACKVRSGEIKTTADLAVSISSLVPRDSAFESSFSFYTTTNNGFARYLLLAIERHLQGEKQPENVPNDNPAEINLEHILPRRAKPTEWPKFKPDEVSSHSVRLGNMTLLKEAKNNAIGNKPFSAKKPVLCTSNYKLNEQFKTQQDWIKDDIETRQLVLAQYAPLVWKL